MAGGRRASQELRPGQLIANPPRLESVYRLLARGCELRTIRRWVRDHRGVADLRVDRNGRRNARKNVGRAIVVVVRGETLRARLLLHVRTVRWFPLLRVRRFQVTGGER